MGCLKGMINYAKEYKNIFSFIFEKDYVKTPEEDKFNKQIVEGIMKAGGYSFEDALMFLIKAGFSHMELPVVLLTDI